MPNDLLWAEAGLGRDAQEFLRSDIGRYILGRCQREIAEAHAKLAAVSPWRRNRIKQLQNEVWRAQSVADWLAEIVHAGQQAEAVLNELQDEA
jgi:hypothetical protein